MRSKYLLFLLLALVWFVASGVFYAEKKDVAHWLSTLFMYVIGGQWVFTGIFGLTMYAPYVGTQLKSVEENKISRTVLFLIGFGFMLGGSLI